MSEIGELLKRLKPILMDPLEICEVKEAKEILEEARREFPLCESCEFLKQIPLLQNGECSAKRCFPRYRWFMKWIGEKKEEIGSAKP